MSITLLVYNASEPRSGHGAPGVGHLSIFFIAKPHSGARSGSAYVADACMHTAGDDGIPKLARFGGMCLLFVLQQLARCCSQRVAVPPAWEGKIKLAGEF
eukprot:356330-Chlamydomonas_euryale.AAC.5